MAKNVAAKFPLDLELQFSLADMKKDANGANAVCGKFSESGEILGENHSTYNKF